MINKQQLNIDLAISLRVQIKDNLQNEFNVPSEILEVCNNFQC